MLASEMKSEEGMQEMCERCEKVKAKVLCYDCGSMGGSSLCEKCSQIIHQSGSFAKHKVNIC